MKIERWEFPGLAGLASAAGRIALNILDDAHDIRLVLK